MAKESVSHKGKVIRITPETTTVSILQHGACSECHAAGLCGMSDLAEKTVDVATDPFANYRVGDEVEVLLKASMGMKAVWLAYFIPLIILLEVPAAIVGLGSIGLYYLGLYLFRDKLKNEYNFTIKS